MTLEGCLREKQEGILCQCAKYGARNPRVFGSMARGHVDAQRDINFLIEMEAGRSLFDLGGLQYELEQLPGFWVDVVTKRRLKVRICDRARLEEIPL